jgi:cytochrome c-type biogenesis protein CcmH
MINRNLLLILFLAIINLPSSSFAVEPSEILQNPQLETRARVLSKNIRCLVCQNQSIDDSNASLAKDLRKVVREQLVNGASDEEIFDFLIERYGDFVLLKPPVKPSTYMLWYGPIILFLIGLLTSVLFLIRRKKLTPQEPLTQKELDQLSKLITNRAED